MQKLYVRIIYIFVSRGVRNSEGAVGLHLTCMWAFKNYESYVMECF